MTDITMRLVHDAEYPYLPIAVSDLMVEAASEITKLRAERDELRNRTVKLLSQLQEYEAREY